MMSPSEINQAIANLDFLISHYKVSSDMMFMSDGHVTNNRMFKTTEAQQTEFKTYIQHLIDEVNTADLNNRQLAVLHNSLSVFINLRPNNLLAGLQLVTPDALKPSSLSYNKIQHLDNANPFRSRIAAHQIPTICKDPHTHKYTSPDDIKAHQHGQEATRIFFSTQFQRSKGLINRLFAYFGIHVFESACYEEHDYLHTDIYANDLPTRPEQSKEAHHYWIGHASNFITIPTDGNPLHVLTDPVEGDLAPVIYPRMTDEGSLIDGTGEKRLPKVDVVLISHNHRDHVCASTLSRLVKHQPIMVVAEGDRALFEGIGFTRVVETTWWEQVVIQDEKRQELLKITAVPASHWSGRGPFDAHCAAFNGYVLSSGKLNGDIYFAGDTALMDNSLSTPIFEQFNVTTSIQPGGPDEMRADMESTHQCSADGILMHFKILAAEYSRGPFITKEQFLEKAVSIKTIFNHTSTFKLGNLRLKDTHFSQQRIVAAFKEGGQWRENHLPAHEMKVYAEINKLLHKMTFVDGKFSNEDVSDLILSSLEVPKIGQCQSLNRVKPNPSYLEYRNLITNRRALIEYDQLMQDHLAKPEDNRCRNMKDLIITLFKTYDKPLYARFTRKEPTKLKNLELAQNHDEALLRVINEMENGLGLQHQHGHRQSLVYYAKWLLTLPGNNYDEQIKYLKKYFVCKNIEKTVDAELKHTGWWFMGASRDEKQTAFKVLSSQLKSVDKTPDNYRQIIGQWRNDEKTMAYRLSDQHYKLFPSEKTWRKKDIGWISEESLPFLKHKNQ